MMKTYNPLRIYVDLQMLEHHEWALMNLVKTAYLTGFAVIEIWEIENWFDDDSIARFAVAARHLFKELDKEGHQLFMSVEGGKILLVSSENLRKIEDWIS